MPARADVLRRLAAVADDLTAIAGPRPVRDQLVALCRTTRLSLHAAAVSIARLDDDVLEYEAADGEGAAAIVGVRLPLDAGLSGYVARTGDALVVDRVTTDPRFARAVAEQTGYVPTSLLVVPITDDRGRGDTIGVLSVLDRDTGAADALAVAGAAAEQAASLLATFDVVVRIAPLLLGALADAVRTGDGDLARALDAEAARAPAGDDLARIAALLARLRTAPPDARARAERVLEELVELAVRRRR